LEDLHESFGVFRLPCDRSEELDLRRSEESFRIDLENLSDALVRDTHDPLPVCEHDPFVDRIDNGHESMAHCGR
jgi:hypothetical protein